MENTLKFHAYLASALADEGADVLYGLIGDANLFFVDEYVRQGGTYVGAVHESSTVMMASGYATSRQRVGFATVTHGPGLSNTATPLIEAAKSGTPLVLVCGDTPRTDKHHPQSIDQATFIASTGAGFEEVRAPNTVRADLSTAIRRAAAERRPIVLNIPAEYMWVDLNLDEQELPSGQSGPTVQPVRADADAIDRALGMIVSARRPVILAGRGAIPARDSLVRLANRLGAALATTVLAKDLFLGEELDLGICGSFGTPVAQDAIIDSDCIVAFGASLNRHTTDNKSMLEGKTVVQCDIDVAQLGKFAKVDAAVLGDSTAIAEEMLAWLDEAEVELPARDTTVLQKSLQAWPDMADRSTASTIDVYTALTRLDTLLPADRTVATDAGRFTGLVMKLLHAPGPSSWLNSWTGFAAIGLGMGMAIGGSVANPGRTTVLVTGDGGFMLGGMNEFTTAVREGCDLICIVCNDSSYGAEHIQFVNRGMDPSLSMFEWPDLATLAESLGGSGVTVRSPGDLQLAEQAILDRSGPLLIELRLDPNLC